MPKLLRAAFMAALFACAMLQPGVAAAQQFAAFSPSGQAPLAASTSSARIALPTGDPTALVQNLGSVTAYLVFGRSTVTATTSGYPIQAGQSIAFAPGLYTHLAAITASGSTSLSVTTGAGFPALANAGGGGGGGGGGGAVTVADGADITQGAVGDAACATDNGACSIAALLKRSNQRTTSQIAMVATAANQIDELSRIGEVQTTPTLYTVLGRLKSIETKLDAIDAKAGDLTPVATKIDQTTPGTTDSVTVKSMGAQGTGATFDPPTGGSGLLGYLSGIFKAVTGTLTVGGSAADGATASGSPVMAGCVYEASPGAVTTGQVSRTSCDPYGKTGMFIGSPGAATTFAYVGGIINGNTAPGANHLIAGSWGQNFNGTSWDNDIGNTSGKVVQPYCVSTCGWSYAAASAGIVNTTTAVTIKAAAGAGVKNCVTSLQLSAETLGAATELAIRDGAGGTVLWRSKIGTGGLALTSIALPKSVCGTANTLLEAVTLTASATGGVYVNAQGYTGL